MTLLVEYVHIANNKDSNIKPNYNLTNWRQSTRKAQSTVVLSPKSLNFPFNGSAWIQSIS